MADGIVGGIGNWLFGNTNPADPAMQYMNQIPGMLQGGYNPFIQAGLGALPTLQQQYGQLMNPNFINQMGKSFQQSPGYQFGINQATNAANRAAAAGGMVGSPQEQQNLAGTVTGMANQDYYNWLNHAMGAYGQGLQGEQGLYQTGFNAQNALSQQMMDAMMSQANLAYAGQANQNQMNQGLFGAAIGGIGSAVAGM